MHGDYGHFHLVFPYVRSINQYTNGHFDQCLLIYHLLSSILTNIDVVSSLCKIWTLCLGIWENNWATMFLSTYYQILIFERDYEAMKV
jgi:hypothetical protein